jgi:uncharacterized repeat protein (TIGR04138 family)
MEEKKDFYTMIEEICEKDSRYKPDAYEFIMQALHFTQGRLKRETHVTGRELLEGIREFAVEQYGPMARSVFAHWGVAKTQDFGNIVFNLVERKILSKTDTDSIEDFKDVYDFEKTFSNTLRDSVIKNLSQIDDDLKKDS